MAPRHALPRAWMRTHAHPRATVRTAVACSIFDWPCQRFRTARPCAPGRYACSGRRLEEPESSFELGKVADVRGRAGNGRRQVWSHQASDLTRGPQALSRSPCSAPHMLSQSTHHGARRCRAVGEPVGALSSRCDAAAFGADRARLRRARRDYFGVRFPRAAARGYFGQPPGRKVLAGASRRRVPVNPGRGAGDAARETAAGRAVGRASVDLPPRPPPEASVGAASRAVATPRVAPGPAHAGSRAAPAHGAAVRAVPAVRASRLCLETGRLKAASRPRKAAEKHGYSGDLFSRRPVVKS